MKKIELLKMIDNELLEKLYGFCYARTSCSSEAEELCSDILFALINTAKREGEINFANAFIWKVARNTYADYAKRRKTESERYINENPEKYFKTLHDLSETVDKERKVDEEQLKIIYREIAFLSRAYREVMIAYYLEGRTIADIAKEQKATENAIRQRLFTARDTVRKEVTRMETNKPVGLRKIYIEFVGSGDPLSGDPRKYCGRQLTNHVLWLCRNREASIRQISDKLNLPMMYVEEELGILKRGENGKYGLIKKLDNGKFTTNFILLDKNELKALQAVYIDKVPLICDAVITYVEKQKNEYLRFPYLNRRVDMNLILWQQISDMAFLFTRMVDEILTEKALSYIEKSNRSFTVFGYEMFEGSLGACGWDSAFAHNVCGYSQVHFENIYFSKIKEHFRCDLNVASSPKEQLAIRAINGLEIDSLHETEKEWAAKAIQCGYLYREGKYLYTKILVTDSTNRAKLFDLNKGLKEDFRIIAEELAIEIAELILKFVPKHLLSDYKYVNILASFPVQASLVESLIERGFLVPPENGIGAEGCWMSVKV